MLETEAPPAPARAKQSDFLQVPSLCGADHRLWLLRPSLNTCVLGVMTRDTQHLSLNEAQRLNHFPATPTCSIGWYCVGQGELLSGGEPSPDGSPRRSLPGAVLFSGPQTRPWVTSNPGPVHGLMLTMVPDAMRALTGLDPLEYRNRTLPIQAVFDAPWQRWCQEILRASDDQQRVRLIEDFLEPRWLAVRPHDGEFGQHIHDWTQGLATRAANAAAGRSVRQAQRRIKFWTGQDLRELRCFSRTEQAFLKAVALIEGGRLNWTELASDAGFSDQSHLCRAFRRITGFSPEEFIRRMDSDESFWVYRIWRQR